MRPGSPERIAYYCRRAKAGLPLFEDAPPGVPHLQSDFYLEPKFEQEQPMNIDQAIELLTSDEAEAKINERIAHHENELAKLKKLAKSFAPAKRSSRAINDPELEQRIVDDIEANGPSTAKAIGQRVGAAYMKIGKVAASSDRLAKDGSLLFLA